MPPPLPADNESDAESITNEIPHTKSELSKGKEESKDTKMKDAGQEEEDEDEEDEELYVVEAIQDHRSDFEDGQMRYLVKWKGYEKKADRTWELEDSFEAAHEILEEYWTSIGGKPTPGAPKSTKKRGRQSTGTEIKQPDSAAKRPKTGRKCRKSNGALNQDASPMPNVGYTEAGDDDWKPPPAKEGAWDPLVQAVDTVIREDKDGELWGYLIWNIQNDDGRYYRSKANLQTIYRACPQRMLHFYEKHLVFSTAPEQPAEVDAKGGE